MKSRVVLAAACALAVVGSASAEDWTGAPALPPSYSNLPGDVHAVSTLQGTEAIRAQCLASSPVGDVFYCDPLGEAGERWISISEFARSSTVTALQAQVNTLAASIGGFATTASVTALQTQLAGVSTSITGLQTQLTALAGDIASLSDTSAAFEAFWKATDGRLAASAGLETLTPSAPGKTTFHLGWGHSGDESAAGATFAHRLNSSLPVTIDGGIALSSDSAVTAKAGIGIEF